MIFEVFDEKKWDSVLLRIGHYDFYHTFKYHFYNRKSEEAPILIVYENNGTLIAFPFLKRSIDDECSDLTSVHGKVGPVAKIAKSTFDNTDFKKEFEEYLIDHNIVSIFSKLNPFIKGQHAILSGLGEIVCTGENMYFDQLESEEEQIEQYSKSTRKKIRRLQEYAIVRECENDEEIDFFIEQHYRNMERIGGSEEYFFSKEYLKSLFEYEMVNAKILFAVNTENNEIMAGKLNVQTNQIVESEIGWTVDKYRDNSPMAILWDEARRMFKNEEIVCINMGGGPGGRNGGVMLGKRRFTKHYINFHIWKYIVDLEKYNALCSEEQLISNSDFFPKYRS
ncbi:hypothetical protein [Flagellimonas beolgyonensis]|uniref:hypothetical protein n=1 Tax=Flagellimonas beolgyonensis TaxID=864064 RepID=UPI000F8F4DAB|nr:hypothetical protein [Allomuricauda beolgyonensis]